MSLSTNVSIPLRDNSRLSINDSDMVQEIPIVGSGYYFLDPIISMAAYNKYRILK